MAELKYPRFNTVYKSRNEAIKKLNELTRSYGEPVAIRYYNQKKVICIIVAIFKSDKIGDYCISYDSNTELQSGVHIVNRESDEKTDQHYITVALAGKTPVEGEIVIIKDGDDSISYIYSKVWEILSTPSEDLILGESVVFEENELGESVLEVKTDKSSIIYDKDAGGLTVSKIYGGTF